MENNFKTYVYVALATMVGIFMYSQVLSFFSNKEKKDK